MKPNEKDPNQTAKTGNEQKSSSPAKEIKGDYLMSEKDEVKQAERNTQKQQNNGK